MRGLLLKDLYSLGNYKYPLLIMVAVVAMMSFTSSVGVTFIPTMLMVFLMMLAVTVFSFDDASNWNRFAISLPLSPRQIVGARYIFALLLLGAGVVISVAVATVYGLVMGDMGVVPTTLGVVAGMLPALVLYNVVIFPIVYKFGAEKGRYIFILLFMGLFLLFFLIPDTIEGFFESISSRFAVAAVVGIAIAAAAYVASFFLSTKIFQSRDY